jgi:four helix bundle protein
MMLDHERLDVSRFALAFLVFAHQVIEALPRGRSHLCDQLTRASTSIVLNLAEGAGKHSKADKRAGTGSCRAWLELSCGHSGLGPCL